MADGVRITLNGMPELEKKLGRLQSDVAGKALENALTSGALLIANDAKDRSPYITGNLRRSIHVGGHANESGGLTGTDGTDIGGNKNSATSAEVLVGTNVDYAGPVEHRKPYLRPAHDENEDQVVKEVGEALKILVDKAAQ